MKILAIDSSGLVATIALLEEEQMLAEYTINYKKTHSQTLLPMIDEITKMTDLDLNTVDAVAIAGGPGSFTGLRIGAATAKGLGLALNKPLISVPTLEGMAYNFYGTDKLICPMMDARRKQVYTGLYSFVPEFHPVMEQDALPVEMLIEKVNECGREIIFLGDGVSVYRELLEKGVAVPYSFAPPHLNRQRAGAAGALAFQYFKSGKVQTASEHRPEYLRKSQAEREKEEKTIHGDNPKNK